MGKPIQASLQEYFRGIIGGLIFSFPLLYTMEVWWAGFIATPLMLLISVVMTFLLLLIYNRYAGMRPDAKWWEIVMDSFEELGLGFLVSFCILLMLNRIQLGVMGTDEIMGKVIIEAMAVSIGVSIGTAQLGQGSKGGEKDNKDGEEIDDSYRKGKVALAGMSVCGAIIVGSNVAPTEEVLMIAVEVDPIHILFMALLSLAMSIIAVYFADFKNTSKDKSSNTLYELTFSTCLCYLVALSASAFLLWFFGRFDNISFWNGFSQVIVLGVLSSLGASAGRLLIT